MRRLLGALVLSVAIAHTSAWAADFTVNRAFDEVDANPGDGKCEIVPGSGACTLRAAIQESNKLAGTDTIHIPAGTYAIEISPVMGTGDAAGNFDITDSVNIVGDGAQTTIIDGAALDNVFANVGNSISVNISNVTIQNGSLPGTATAPFGGGLFANRGSHTTLTDVIVRSNAAGDGGGIYSLGDLTLIRTLVEGNTAVRTNPGVVDFRRGGGVFQAFGILTIRDSSIRGNTAISAGGVFSMGTADIESSTISGNTATNVSLNNGDGGGGVVNGAALAGTMTITNSTISGNSANANYGGIFNANGTVTLNNVTVADNVADADGNGVGMGGGLGLSPANVATATLRDTIVAGNAAAGTAVDCSSPVAAAITSGGYNLIGNAGSATDCAWTAATGDQVGTPTNPVNPGLQPLADNGGPTMTRALMDMSPAIDAGNPNGCTDGTNVLSTDQRGMPRSARCDIGAYELLKPTADAGPDQRVNAGVLVTLDGSASSATSGIASYAWTQVAGTGVSLNGADTATPSFTAPAAAGVLTFQLSVTDNFGTTATDTVDVTVNAAPVADAGPDQTVGTGAQVSLNGTASSDGDGTIVAYAWMQTSGTPVALSNADTATPSFTAPATADTLVFQLTVTDNDGATGVDSVSITVSAPVPAPSANIPPVADAGPDQTVRPHSLVFLNGWGSYDPDGKIVRYRWVQTGGPHVRLFVSWLPWAVFIAPHEEGALTFELAVTDDKGATSSDSVTVTVDGCVERWWHRFFHHRGRHHGHECR